MAWTAGGSERGKDGGLRKENVVETGTGEGSREGEWVTWGGRGEKGDRRRWKKSEGSSLLGNGERK